MSRYTIATGKNKLSGPGRVPKGPVKTVQDLSIDPFIKQNNIQELELLTNIKKNLRKLRKLLKEVNRDSNYGNWPYRFYHGSFKVYHVQGLTIRIVETLKGLAPEGITIFNSMFEDIFKEGTGKEWKHEHNQKWMKHTRPMLEAFFHALYFLRMSIKYGEELDEAPDCLPSGWAGVLYFYNLR